MSERKPWLRSPSSDRDAMSLPIGKTCGLCAWVDGCKKLINVNLQNEVCDWSPSRFVEVKSKDEQ